jgi:hypothetical protein
VVVTLLLLMIAALRVCFQTPPPPRDPSLLTSKQLNVRCGAHSKVPMGFFCMITSHNTLRRQQGKGFGNAETGFPTESSAPSRVATCKDEGTQGVLVGFLGQCWHAPTKKARIFL